MGEGEGVKVPRNPGTVCTNETQFAHAISQDEVHVER